jgi:hypothetical protein
MIFIKIKYEQKDIKVCINKIKCFPLRRETIKVKIRIRLVGSGTRQKD